MVSCCLRDANLIDSAIAAADESKDGIYIPG